ncbi:AAA family ATPase [Desulfovibrio sp. TomC]|uniref:AAA family ATPase n=1 Tax=Desulfovibrio sp. TomC TaxID=1562888 RepID=UPI0005743C1C|nr:AAA family ATPase [Desulfovibrio sp. TomC]KHK00206.1 putative ATPase [Desulfovibrio sp. TomC]
MDKLRITKIEIKGLFGYLDHPIELNDSGITFIHGPNGCGKTTILNLVSAIFSNDFYAIASVDFLSINILFSDSSVLAIMRDVKKKQNGRLTLVDMGDDSQSDYVALRLEYHHSDHKINSFDFPGDIGKNNNRISTIDIINKVPFLRRVGPREWIDRRTEEVLSYDGVLKRFYGMLFDEADIPRWYYNLCGELNIQYIKTQRLLSIDHHSARRDSERPVQEAIQIYAKELQNLMSEKLAEQAATSQEYDSSFPERLLSGEVRQESEKDVRNRYQEIDKKTKALVNAGLINKQRYIPLPEQILDSNQLRVMTLYLDDMESKLAVFDVELEKINAFLDIVARKLHGKTLLLSRNDGFSIVAKNGERPDSQKISPSYLSSGEQHQIVLFYELIFKSKVNTLYLIDEPEISLHIDWQRKFIDDILKVKCIGDSYFLIATHSPQIIGSHYDEAIALNGGILEEQE